VSPRTVAIWHTAASVIFIGAGIAGLADKSLLGGSTMAVVVLLIGVMDAGIARYYWLAYRRLARHASIGAPD
jgi:hypothetical protein